jgi:hypothetical protein
MCAVRYHGVFFLVAAVLAALSPDARAEDELLRGPHPFSKDNELAFHIGYGAGLGGNARGLRVQGDFSNRLGQSLWVDIQMAIVSGGCHTDETSCRNGSGSAVEVLGGAVWKFQTKLPIVPYAKVNAGPTFIFPDGTRSAAGILFRGGAGAHYFFYDWFGVGAEFSTAAGVAFYGGNGRSSGALGSFDANLGVALQF